MLFYDDTAVKDRRRTDYVTVQLTQTIVTNLNSSPRRCNLICAQVALAARYGAVLLYDGAAVKNRYRTEDDVTVQITRITFTDLGFHSSPPRRCNFIGAQVALATRYGAVLLYDDTAVKNRYHLPLGLGVVIDGEYNTRVVFQTVTADAKTHAFEWMLETYKQARGAAPDVFIQDADAAMTQAAQRVFPHAKRRRCLWHLERDVAKNLKALLGGQFNVRHYCMVQSYGQNSGR